MISDKSFLPQINEQFQIKLSLLGVKCLIPAEQLREVCQTTHWPLRISYWFCSNRWKGSYPHYDIPDQSDHLLYIDQEIRKVKYNKTSSKKNLRMARPTSCSDLDTKFCICLAEFFVRRSYQKWWPILWHFTIKCGVPQGSVLRTLIFTSFFNGSMKLSISSTKASCFDVSYTLIS